MIKKFLEYRMNKAFKDNESYLSKLIFKYVASRKGLKILDVGCSNGEMTLALLKGVVANNEIYGLDFEKKRSGGKIKYSAIDLEKGKFPYKDNYFDVVYSNQVIEHLLNKDLLLSESYRVLKPGGLFIVSTENIASVDNIVSLVLGQEPVCQHTGYKYHTNSFLSGYFMHEMDKKVGNTFGHKNVCSYYGLQRLVTLSGFKKLSIRSFGNLVGLLELLFPIYNRVITVSTVK